MSKSFCSISHHFCFDHKMSLRPLFAPTFEQTHFLINIIYYWSSYTIKLCVMQFWCEIIRVNPTCPARTSEIKNHAYHFRPNSLHSVQVTLLLVPMYLKIKVISNYTFIVRRILHRFRVSMLDRSTVLAMRTKKHIGF